MILYHFNLGWPLLDEKALLQIPCKSTTPRDERAIAGLDSWSIIEPPKSGFLEQVFFHEAPAGRGLAVIDNPELDLRLEIQFSTDTLPGLFQWKMSDVGHYVMGIEPSNTHHVHGHRSAKEGGFLPILAPGQSVAYEIDIVFSGSQHKASQ
jgi:hypothetical protein